MAEKKAAAPQAEGTVRIMLPKDNNEHRGELYVSINMEEWRLPRGVPIDVPEKVAEVIRQQMEAEGEAYAYGLENQNRHLADY